MLSLYSYVCCDSQVEFIKMNFTAKLTCGVHDLVNKRFHQWGSLMRQQVGEKIPGEENNEFI